MGALSKKVAERPIEHELLVEVDLLKLSRGTSAHVEQAGLLAKEHRHNSKTPGRTERSTDGSTAVLRQRPRPLNYRRPCPTTVNLALLHLCMDDERPFPNFVLIDSPLLVYEDPDQGEAPFPPDIKGHFWKSVKTSFVDAQVIIIENRKQLPSDGAISDVNVVLSSGTDIGRQGFLPQVGSAS